MKKIFVYGDSNVWGDNFLAGRVPYHLRWTSRLKRSLAGVCVIVANGVRGRVAGDFRVDKPERNGRTSFEALYAQVTPVDIVVVALGTNDLQRQYGRSADDIIDDLLWYKTVARTAQVLFIMPPNFDLGENSGPEFTHESEMVRQQVLQRSAALGEHIITSALDLSDGVHFSADGHKMMAETVRGALREYI
jgi:lysophospholipase L1-like esterase